MPHKLRRNQQEQAPNDKCKSQQPKGKRNTPKQAEAPARQNTTPTTTTKGNRNKKAQRSSKIIKAPKDLNHSHPRKEDEQPRAGRSPKAPQVNH